MSRLRTRLLPSLAAAGLLAIAVAGPVAAHVVEHAGPYTIEIGWQHEPTYVGEANGVQVIIHDQDDKPVTDLKEDDLKAVVSTGGQQTGELTFAPGFDPEEMEGNLGEYDAAILPTAPGDYTFHITGAIHGSAVDFTVTSGAETFDTVKGTSDIEFPTKLPTIPEIVTRLDRLDARVASTPAPSAPTAPTGPTQESVAAAQASAADAKVAADDAKAAADRSLLIATAVGAAGLIVAVVALAVAVRSNRRSQA